ncbi:uncharacterized protein [Cicer arietinum]|uniref:Acidic leucine-rich nuclear phosphoprotein 32 family member E n=2 Tax=Cicer arietinum TaxID=3827 RepID=A0A1S2YR72_CICAR|nr:acidic leucine-rich nuclear phosphoprotein 32 family member E [Cicer arietinum]
MKPYSKNFGIEEECQSSESGWTMYIGSPIEDDDNDDDDEDDGDIDNMDDEEGTHEAHDDLESDDDSMASDASSGPSHQHYGRDYGLEGLKQVVVEDENNKYCLEKKENKTMENEGKNVEKKEMIFVDGKGKSSVHVGGGKVRKNYLVGGKKGV